MQYQKYLRITNIHTSILLKIKWDLLTLDPFVQFFFPLPTPAALLTEPGSGGSQQPLPYQSAGPASLEHSYSNA